MNFRVRATILSVVGLVLVAMPAHAQKSDVSPKVVYVNTQALLNVAPGYAAAESTYSAESKTWSDELKKMSDDIQTMISDYQQALARHGMDSLTDAAKQARTKAIQAKQKAFADRQSQLQQQAQQRENDLMAPVMENVREMLEKIRAENGYSLILDSQAVVAADQNLDITNNVVARLKIAASAQQDSSAKHAVKKKK